MFLKRIRLENVRCIEDVELSFEAEKGNRKWTILVGDNGSGKSTILKAIALLLNGSESLLDLLHFPESWIRNGADTCRISGVITTKQGKERELTLTLGRDRSFRDMLDDNDESLKRLDAALEHTNRSYLTLGYGGSRHSDALGGFGDNIYRHPRAQAVATLFNDHAKMIPFEQWAMDLELRKSKTGVKLIREALAGILPGVSFDSLDSQNRTIWFNTPDGKVPLKYLSAGYRNIIQFCGDLLYRITEVFEDYKNPLSTRGLLLIDELGLHLHPKWQRVLMQFLTEKLPNLQIVATTNAPVTAHQAGEGELWYLRRHELNEPPTLHQFEGSANKLLLHQLILSPVFGLDTANSHDAENLKSEFQALKKKTRKTAKDEKRLKELGEHLDEITDWRDVHPRDREMKELLSKIEKEISSK